MRTFAILALLSVAGAASAAQLWYGGDADGVNGLSSEQNTTISDARTYDDFTLTSTSNITQLYGNFLSNTNTSSMYYEIRSGVSVGNGGTLLQSGTIGLTSQDTGNNYFGFEEFKYTGNVNFNLNAGTYWMTLAAIGDGTGRAFIATTSGANAVGSPVLDGNAYFDSTFFGVSFGAAGDQLGGNPDFSFGVNGTPAPEPASFAALAIGAVVLIRRRRKA